MLNKRLSILWIVGFLSLFCKIGFAEEGHEAMEDRNLQRFDQVIELLQNDKLSDKERAGLLFEKGTLMFETFGELYLRTATESLVGATKLQPDNSEYKDYLREVYNQLWNDKDLEGDDEDSVGLRALRDEVKRIIN